MRAKTPTTYEKRLEMKVGVVVKIEVVFVPGEGRWRASSVLGATEQVAWAETKHRARAWMELHLERSLERFANEHVPAGA
jgi:hypothetical protein